MQETCSYMAFIGIYILYLNGTSFRIIDISKRYCSSGELTYFHNLQEESLIFRISFFVLFLNSKNRWINGIM